MKWLLQSIVAMLVAGAAVGYGYYYAPPGVVEAIRVTKLSSMPELRLPSKPDYYLVLQLHSGERVQLPTYANRPIGNGLVWPLDPPLRLADLAEVQLYDENLIFRDEMLDRAIVEARVHKTTQHGFELIGPESSQWKLALAAAVPAGAYALVCLILFVRWQAIPPKK